MNPRKGEDQREEAKYTAEKFTYRRTCFYSPHCLFPELHRAEGLQQTALSTCGILSSGETEKDAECAWQSACFFCCISSFIMSLCTHKDSSSASFTCFSSCSKSLGALLLLLFSCSCALQHLQEDIFPGAFLYCLISVSLAAAVKGAPLKGSQVEDSD